MINVNAPRVWAWAGYGQVRQIRRLGAVSRDWGLLLACGLPARQRTLIRQFRTLGVRPERVPLEDFAALAK